jgi:hypothetical protein
MIVECSELCSTYILSDREMKEFENNRTFQPIFEKREMYSVQSQTDLPNENENYYILVQNRDKVLTVKSTIILEQFILEDEDRNNVKFAPILCKTFPNNKKLEFLEG